MIFNLRHAQMPMPSLAGYGIHFTYGDTATFTIRNRQKYRSSAIECSLQNGS
jgi:hypothetical protein